jgi:HTH-type transcriptional regulator/antitoxin HigA
MATEEKQRIWSDTPVHPGEILEEELGARQMTQRELATRMGRQPQVVNQIVRGKKSITAETALGLERALGVSARTWMNL